MGNIIKTRKRNVILMRRTPKIIANVIKNISQQTATTLRDPDDGDKGWTTLEVLCHLRDFDEIFRMRAMMIVEQEYPDLPFFDHEAMAIERDYNSQNLHEVYNQYLESRRETASYFRHLTDEQWDRRGVHPEYGEFNMMDAASQIGLHDITHIEQITKILAQLRSL